MIIYLYLKWLFLKTKEVFTPHVHAVESNGMKAAAEVAKVIFQSVGITARCNEGFIFYG